MHTVFSRLNARRFHACVTLMIFFKLDKKIVYLVPESLSGSDAEVDFVLLRTVLLVICERR